MNRPIDPLEPEERALAERLSRLGPHDGPPAALDAKILAAAHAAAASDTKPARRRWWAALGVPPALVTGIGTAVAATLVLGIAWQLRPPPSLVAERAAHDAGALVVVEPQAPAPRRLVAPPPPAAADDAAQLEAAAEPAAERRAAAAAESAPAPAPAPAVPPPPPAPAAEADDAFVLRSPPRNDAETVSSAVFGADPPEDAVAKAQGIAHVERAARHERAMLSAQRSDDTAAAANEATSARAVRSASAAAPPDDADLDRIEVTGSRIDADAPTGADRRRIADALRIPVRRDRQLAPQAWLQRIRDRRDGGRTDQARESLQALRRAHPDLELPDDVRALAQ